MNDRTLIALMAAIIYAGEAHTIVWDSDIMSAAKSAKDLLAEVDAQKPPAERCGAIISITPNGYFFCDLVLGHVGVHRPVNP
jgi:hypothetical protein